MYHISSHIIRIGKLGVNSWVNAFLPMFPRELAPNLCNNAARHVLRRKTRFCGFILICVFLYVKNMYIYTK